jgi:hypothetical protein
MTTMNTRRIDMTAQPAPDKMTAQELRDQFHQLFQEMEQLRADFENMRAGLMNAASRQNAGTETYKDFDASEILLSYDDKGQPTYKIKGVPFSKFGVRVWPEVLPDLGIDPDTLRPGPNLFRCKVRALMFEATSEAGTLSMQPKKIIGKADAEEIKPVAKKEDKTEQERKQVVMDKYAVLVKKAKANGITIPPLSAGMTSSQMKDQYLKQYKIFSAGNGSRLAELKAMVGTDPIRAWSGICKAAGINQADATAILRECEDDFVIAFQRVAEQYTDILK